MSRTRARLSILVVAVIALFAGRAVPMHTSTPARAAQLSLAATGSSHLVLIMMENKSYAQIVGNPVAPYINQTLIPSGRLFTQYYSITHPSLPNYLVVTGGDFHGCVSDACPLSIAGENVFHELNAAGISWKAYAEGMPSNCLAANSGKYVTRHNPPVYYTNLSAAGDATCASKDVPFTKLATDLANGSLPAFAYIAPNQVDNMHNNANLAPCALGDVVKNEICQGDTWLSQQLPAILSDGGRNDTTVVLAFDEAATGSNQGGGGQIVLLEVGAGIPGGATDSTPANHYGLANAIADWFGVPRLYPTVPNVD